jgi:class 3 adenylate cyclase
LYDRGLRLLPQEADNRLDLLVEAGEAVLFDTDRRLAVAFASEARELARRRADALAESRALQVMQRDAWLSGDSLRGIAFASEARELLRGRGDREEARALARLVRLLTLADRRSEALEMLPGAIELARQSGSFGWLSMLEGTRMLLASEDSEFDHAYRSAVAAAQAGNDLGAEQNLAANAGYTRIWYGELERSRGYFQRAIELNERFTPYDPYPQAGYAWLLSLLGDYGEAVRYADPLRGRGQIPTRIVALTARYEVAERRGEPEAGALADELWAIARSTGESQRSVPAVAARARNALVHGGLDAAAPLFRAALERTTTELVTGSHWMFSPDFAYALAEEERVDELAHWVDDVGKLTRGDPNAQNLAAQALCDGYLAAARGQPGEARLLFTAAATRYRSLPCPAREVEALLGLADVEWQAHRAEESLAAAQSAVELAERIGASVLARRAEDARIRAEAPTVLASVLFTDIVGSTERAAELGDRAWKELLERHHALVRRELTRWHGREIDTAGDGFLAAFDSPAQAIRCACAIRDALAAAGVPIRAGLHTGECQQSREKLTGIAVHVAARVNAAARPGEVLVSATVRDLVAGSGFAFEDRGMHVLKGVPGDWRLFAVSR